MLDLVLGTGVLTLIITIFGLLATGYRLCRPLLWIYAMTLISTMAAQLGLIFWNSVRVTDLQQLGYNFWSILNSNTRNQFEKEFTCCGYQNISKEYEKKIPEHCFDENIVEGKLNGRFPNPDDKLFEDAILLPCFDQVNTMFLKNKIAVYSVTGIIFGFEVFQLISCFILLATRLPYKKNREKNMKMMSFVKNDKIFSIDVGTGNRWVEPANPANFSNYPGPPTVEAVTTAREKR